MPEPGSYHHGHLPEALLAAVDELVREAGVGGVTLRGAARRAGVSHTAPAHHFGDKAGLLTAFATRALMVFEERLRQASAAARAAGEPELLAIGLAYIRFAVEQPGWFAVMFRPEHLHTDEASYREAADGAYGVLVEAVRRLRPELGPDDPNLEFAATGAWSIVHGFATLWLEGSLAEVVTAEPLERAAAATLAEFGATLLLNVDELAELWPHDLSNRGAAGSQRRV